MTKLTLAEIDEFRSQLADNPDALIALDTIEDCEGDVEDAAIVLAIRDKLEPDQANSSWLESLAKQCRGTLCQADMKELLSKGLVKEVVDNIKASGLVPSKQALLVVIYALKVGLNEFCSF